MRDAFEEFIAMDIHQKELENNTLQTSKSSKITASDPSMYSLTHELIFPNSTYTSYTYSSQNFLLRKTATGYSLYYQEETGANNDLLLKGKITIKDASIIFDDSQQK